MVKAMTPVLAAASALLLISCGGTNSQGQEKGQLPAAAAVSVSDALPPERTGGFDGARAFAHVEAQVRIGPRASGSEGIRKVQEYLRAQLKGFGCTVEEDDFQARTPLGPIPMKNLLVKVPGKKSDMVLLLTHYETLRMENFVGANDPGSSTGLMLELARLLCSQKRELTVWIAFLDGEEAIVEWSDTDSIYGSRQLAAQMALRGELKRVRAVVLADMVGDRDLNFYREQNSTPWLNELVWNTAHRLGYSQHFQDGQYTLEDDHLPFLRRGIPAVDIIDYNYTPWWHTPEDSLDKISARSLGIVGHVILEVIGELEKKFR
jgi:hypothetical protein